MDDEQLLGTEECRQSGNLFQLFAISFRNKYFFAGVNESDDAVQTLNWSFICLEASDEYRFIFSKADLDEIFPFNSEFVRKLFTNTYVLFAGDSSQSPSYSIYVVFINCFAF